MIERLAYMMTDRMEEEKLLGKEMKEALTQWNRGGDRELAQTVLEAARARGQQDDMTVMVVGIE